MTTGTPFVSLQKEYIRLRKASPGDMAMLDHVAVVTVPHVRVRVREIWKEKVVFRYTPASTSKAKANL